MNQYIVAIYVLSVTIIGGLIYLASQTANIMLALIAVAVLSILMTVGLISLGAFIATVNQKIAAEKSIQSFQDNAKENLAIIQSLQKVQNEQNKLLMGQALNGFGQQQLPASNMMLDASLFDNLE